MRTLTPALIRQLKPICEHGLIPTLASDALAGEESS
jgi:hypothetical protein